MSEFVKHIIAKFILPLLAPVLVGLGSAVISTLVLNAELKGRVSHIEDQVARHEKVIDKEIARHEQNVKALSGKTDDQEKRLTRLETLVDETQKMLSEIRSDVKTLILNGKK